MKTPEEIIGHEIDLGLREPVSADDIIEALDAAGYVIAKKEPSEDELRYAAGIGALPPMILLAKAIYMAVLDAQTQKGQPPG